MSTRSLKIFFSVLLMYCAPLFTFGQLQDQLEWNELPAIPDEEGFAGMFAGVSNGALIVMGGANFPEKMPWKGGEKVWSDHIYILEEATSSWKLADEKLPRPLAYGLSFSYNNQIVFLGGSNSEGHFSEVYSLVYERGKIKIKELPALPFKLANMSGALVGDVFFVAGGNKTPTGMPIHSFLAYNLKNQEWKELASWPGPPRKNSVSASLQNNFFLFSGINIKENSDGSTERLILRDGYKFVPIYREDNIIGGKWTPLAEMPRGVAAGPNPAPTFGLHHILFPGGLDGNTAGHTDPEKHPGFVTDLPVYHVQSDTWLNFGNIPEETTRVTAPSVKWNQKWIIPNGEVSPGKRSPRVFALSKEDVVFGWLNWLSVFLYMGLMIWMGYIFSKRGKTTEDFFKASGRIPWWAAGISIYATQLSAITFMAIPAIVFATDWSVAIGSIMILAIVPIIIKYYLPFFRRLNITSAYEYLEHRFNVNVRLLGSVSFILLQVGRMGVVLFLPALALSTVTGIDIYILIGIMGVISIIYTVMGGIEAVIWTDVVQVVVLLGGAIICIVLAVYNIDGGLEGMIAKGLEANKFTILHFGWDIDKLVVWVGLVGFFFINLIPYTSDQTVVQRYLTVKDERAAAQGLWTNGIVLIPAIIIFYGLGTALFIYYQDNPAVLPSEEVRDVLPYFIVSKLPVGVAGVVIAGIFAASMSSLDSSMNSVSTSYVTDIHRRFHPGIRDDVYLRIAKKVTVIMGIIGTASAMIIAALDVQIIFDLFQEIVGLLGGGLAGLFILGIFTERTSATGAICGLFAGALITWWVRQSSGISLYLYGAVGVVSCITVGYLMSFLFPQRKDIKGFTYSTLKKKR